MKIFVFALLVMLALPPVGMAKTSSGKKPAAKTVNTLIRSYEKNQPFQDSFRTIVALGPDAVDPLMKLAEDNTLPDHQRWTAVRAVGRIGDQKALPGLKKLLNDPHPIMRIAGLRAIGDMGAHDAVPEVMTITEKDPAMIVRSAGIEVLGQLKASEAIPVLEKSLTDERNFINGKSLFIRRRAVVAMGQVESRIAMPTLIKALDDKDETLHPAAVASLQKITGIKFDARNQASVSKQWKQWWETEQRRIPQLPAPTNDKDPSENI